MPNTVEVIGLGAFSGCDCLKSVKIPDGINSIGKYAFDGCFMLEEVRKPVSVTEIGEYAFRACRDLRILCEIESKPDGWEDTFSADCSEPLFGYKS